MTKGSTNDSQSAAARKTKKVVFKPTAETMSGDEYVQDSKILFDRAIAKRKNPNALVFNPKLGPTTPILDGEEQTDEWPSTDPAYFQSDRDRFIAKQEKEEETPLTGKWTPGHAGYRGWFGKALFGGNRKTKKRKSQKMYDELINKLSKSVEDTESAHMVEDQILWMFVSDVANGNLKPDETIQVAKRINDVIIQGRKDVVRWFA